MSCSRTARTISYLTCARSLASKKSEEANRSSVTASGCEFRQRVSRSAATLGSSARLVWVTPPPCRSEEHTSELQSLRHLVCRLLLEKKKINKMKYILITH